jgi:hypothetical protein
MSEHPIPSQEARDLVRGAFDVHIHIGPDVVERSTDDIDLAHRFQELGLEGFIMKSHYTSTAERASVVRKAVPGITALGALAMNSAIGGMNPLAVDIAGREGAQVVWMPTVDAHNETAGRTDPKPGDKVPVWAKLQHELRAQGLSVDPVYAVRDGEVLPETRAVLEQVAKYDMVLATGHLPGDETFLIVEAALAAGVKTVVATHPDFPANAISIEDQVRLADMGALVERCFTTPYTGKCTWEHWLEGARAVGPERILVSTDLGQTINPPVEDGLPLMAERFLEAGFTEEEVRTMIVTNSRRVAGVEDGRSPSVHGRPEAGRRDQNAGLDAPRS